jgi:hypothetical protein
MGEPEVFRDFEKRPIKGDRGYCISLKSGDPDPALTGLPSMPHWDHA